MSQYDSDDTGRGRRLRLRTRGLYAITDQALCDGASFEASVRAALRGGARIVQYRDKSTDRARRQRQAEAVVALCAAFGALSIINDDLELALSSGADGVHLGREDHTIAAARAALGANALIGVSCYNSLAPAPQAVAAGADYVAFGSFYPSPTKPEAVRARPELLRQASAELAVPVTAIGGITVENAACLIDAGADHVAVISAVFGLGDVESAAREFMTLFPSP